MYVCIHVCTKSFLKTTTNSSCVCTHLANKADSDSDQTRIVNPAATSSFPHFIESVIEIICHVMHCADMLFIGWRCSAHPQCPAVPRERGQTHPWPWALRADRTDPRAAAEITVSVNTQQSLCGFKQRGGFYYTSDPWRPSQRDPTQSNTHTLNLCVRARAEATAV